MIQYGPYLSTGVTMLIFLFLFASENTQLSAYFVRNYRVPWPSLSLNDTTFDNWKWK